MIDPRQLAQLEQQNGLPQGLLAAVQRAESGGNPDAVSPKGALGAFQFMPQTAQAYGINPLDPHQAAVGAARMYGDLSKQFNGDVPSMLAAYNWGSGNVEKQGLAKAPQETRDYIAKVTAAIPKQYAQADTGTMTDTAQVNPPPPEGFNLPEAPAGFTSEVSPPPAGFELTEAPKAKDQSLIGKLGSTQFSKDVNKETSDMANAGVKNMLALGSSEPAWKAESLGGQFLANAARPFRPIYGAAEAYGAPVISTLDNLISKPVANITGSETAGALAGLAGAVLAPSAGKGALEKFANVVKSTEGIGTPLRLGATNALEKRAADKAGYDPIKGIEAMADTYAGQAKITGKLYDTVSEIAKGKPINTAGLADDIGGLINDIKADPFHEARGTLPKLQALQTKLENTIPEAVGTPMAGGIPKQGVKSVEKFDLSDAVDLKKLMNESFKQNRWTQNAKGTVYGDLGAKVGNILDQAAIQHPDFGEAKSIADKYWLNNVQNTFKDNAILAKYFKVDDLREIQALRDGRVAELHPETLARARATIKNIKTETDLDAVRKILPPEMAKSLSKQVLKQQGSSGRAGSALAAFRDLKTMNVGGAIRNSANVVAGVEKTPEQLALIRAAKAKPPRLRTAEELKKLGKK